MPETHEEPERCPSCMTPFESHSGLVGTCRQLQEVRDLLAVAERERDAVASMRVEKRGGDWVAHVGGAVVGPFATPAEAIRRVIDNACVVAKRRKGD